MAYTSRGDAWATKKEYDKAIADYNEAIRLDPKDAMRLRQPRHRLAAKKEYDKAIADFDEAIRLDPKLAMAYHQSRRCLAAARRSTTRPSPTTTEAIRLDPEDAPAYDNARARAGSTKGESRQGHRRLRRGDPARPADASAYSNRGVAWCDKKDYDKAIADFDEAIRLDPEDRDRLTPGWAWARRRITTRPSPTTTRPIRARPARRHGLQQPRLAPGDLPRREVPRRQEGRRVGDQGLRADRWKDAASSTPWPPPMPRPATSTPRSSGRRGRMPSTSDAETKRDGEARLKLYRDKKPYHAELP